MIDEYKEIEIFLELVGSNYLWSLPELDQRGFADSLDKAIALSKQACDCYLKEEGLESSELFNCTSFD